MGDRGYARSRGLQHVLAARADFIVRVGWYSLHMTTAQVEPLDWEPIYAGLAPGEVTERRVVVTRRSKGPGRRKALFPARLVVMRQHAAAGERALRATQRRHTRSATGAVMQPLTLASTGYLMVLTSLPAEAATAAEVLAAYGLRWQVELAFKRLKSGLGIDRLPARDPATARSWLLTHLTLALLIEDAAGEVLDAPCAPGRPRAPRHVTGRHITGERPCPNGCAAGPPHLQPSPAQGVAGRGCIDGHRDRWLTQGSAVTGASDTAELGGKRR